VERGVMFGVVDANDDAYAADDGAPKLDRKLKLN
jgi:hypothetical protein